MISKIALVCLVICRLHTTDVDGLYFSVPSYNFTLWSLPSSPSELVRIYPLHSPPDGITSPEIRCVVGQEHGVDRDGADALPSDSSVFLINATNHWIKNKSPLDSYSKGRVVGFRLEVSCAISDDEHSSQTAVDVFIWLPSVSDASSSCTGTVSEALFKTMCFQTSLSLLTLYENQQGMVVHGVGSLLRMDGCGERYSRTLSLTFTGEGASGIDYTQHFKVNQTTGEVEVARGFDREGKASLSYTVMCKMRNRGEGGLVYMTSRNLEVAILDVDDNAPYIQLIASPPVQVADKSYGISKFDKPKSFMIIDDDLASSNLYDVYLVGDELNVFTVQPLVTCVYQHFCRTEMRLIREDNAIPDGYQVDLVFNDTSVVSTHNSSAVYRITILNPGITTPRPTHPALTETNRNESETVEATVQDEIGDVNSDRDGNNDEDDDLGGSDETGDDISTRSVEAEIFSGAARYSRVNISLKDASSSCRHRLVSAHDDVFSVTPRDAILFIRQPYRLSDMPSQIVLSISCEGTADVGRINVRVKIRPGQAQTKARCENTCARFHNDNSCVSGCGVGAARGRCSWRHDRSDRLDHYATCSPTLITCPDQVCDELEATYPDICPQDCITRVPDDTTMNTDVTPARGIRTCSKNMVSCISANSCRCDYLFNATSDFRDLPDRSSWPTTSKSTNIKRNHTDDKWKRDDMALLCGTKCRIIVVSVFGGCIMMLLISVMMWCLRKRKQNKLKHVVSVGSISPVQSDNRHPNESGSMADWASKIIYTSIKPDPKWDFPRENLTFGEVLGEGEFGKVMKAEAYKLPGSSSDYTTVAVKMNKDVASSSELNDLVSEYNMLKDLSHKNIIKLLGVCARGGPFLIIVEFCQHGCLRSYLRRFRPQKRDLLRFQDKNSLPRSLILDKPIEPGISAKDLLSFCWQIALGMQYLAKVKFVHRDLAARNILVASGKVIKISDMGLTRDIYEEDTYIKRSKCRIPVKWMAPESLTNQVYTSRSDVWSFGVVLWEITTFGMSPYPGIQHERVLTLLQEGYRMAKPQNCSDHLYKIMRWCWQYAPIQRPSFRELTDYFENMLKENVDYLDLNCDMESGFGEDVLDNVDSESPSGSFMAEPAVSDVDYGSISFLTAGANAYVKTPVSKTAPSEHPLSEWTPSDCDVIHNAATEKTFFLDPTRDSRHRPTFQDSSSVQIEVRSDDDEAVGSDDETLMLETYHLVSPSTV